jgi:hypothetical protein
MPVKFKIPQAVKDLNPTLTEKEIRTIIKTILNSKTVRLRQADIVDIKIPHIGRLKSHGKKKPKRHKKAKLKDKKRKFVLNRKKELEKNNLLF